MILPALAYADRDNDKGPHWRADNDEHHGSGDNDQLQGKSENSGRTRGKRSVGVNFCWSGPAVFCAKSLPWRGGRIERLLNCRDLLVGVSPGLFKAFLKKIGFSRVLVETAKDAISSLRKQKLI